MNEHTMTQIKDYDKHIAKWLNDTNIILDDTMTKFFLEDDTVMHNDKNTPTVEEYGDCFV